MYVFALDYSVEQQRQDIYSATIILWKVFFGNGLEPFHDQRSEVRVYL